MKVFTVILLGVLFIFTVWLLVIQGVKTLLRQHAAESFPHGRRMVPGGRVAGRQRGLCMAIFQSPLRQTGFGN